MPTEEYIFPDKGRISWHWQLRRMETTVLSTFHPFIMYTNKNEGSIESVGRTVRSYLLFERLVVHFGLKTKQRRWIFVCCFRRRTD